MEEGTVIAHIIMYSQICDIWVILSCFVELFGKPSHVHGIVCQAY